MFIDDFILFYFFAVVSDLKSEKVVSSVQFNGTCAEKDVPKLFIGDTYELNISFTPGESVFTNLLAY